MWGGFGGVHSQHSETQNQTKMFIIPQNVTGGGGMIVMDGS